MPAPPQNEAELLARAEALAGLTLAEVARRLARPVPADLHGHKGWVGEIVEQALGAPGGSAPGPDFPALGIELKTIPVRGDGRPAESTHVCAVPLAEIASVHWRDSPVRRKLARVLWVPVEAGPRPLAGRRIGTAALWSPTPAQEAELRADWEELMDLVGLGELDQVTARHGRSLQIRPKAADGRALTGAVGPDGTPVMTLPRGFYLRPAFTAAILHQACMVRPAGMGGGPG